MRQQESTGSWPSQSQHETSCTVQDQVEQYEAAGISRDLAISIVESEHNLSVLERAERPRRNTSPAEAVQAPGSNQAARDQLSALDRYKWKAAVMDKSRSMDLYVEASLAKLAGVPQIWLLHSLTCKFPHARAYEAAVMQRCSASWPRVTCKFRTV